MFSSTTLVSNKPASISRGLREAASKPRRLAWPLSRRRRCAERAASHVACGSTPRPCHPAQIAVEHGTHMIGPHPAVAGALQKSSAYAGQRGWSPPDSSHSFVAPEHSGKVLAVVHGLLRLARGCLKRCHDRRNPNFAIELGEEIARSTRSGCGLRNVLFGYHFFCPFLNA
jgi:hypothetical protein